MVCVCFSLLPFELRKVHTAFHIHVFLLSIAFCCHYRSVLYFYCAFGGNAILLLLSDLATFVRDLALATALVWS